MYLTLEVIDMCGKSYIYVDEIGSRDRIYGDGNKTDKKETKATLQLRTPWSNRLSMINKDLCVFVFISSSCLNSLYVLNVLRLSPRDGSLFRKYLIQQNNKNKEVSSLRRF